MWGLKTALLACYPPLQLFVSVAPTLVNGHFVSPIGRERTLFTLHQLFGPWLRLGEADELQ